MIDVGTSSSATLTLDDGTSVTGGSISIGAGGILDVEYGASGPLHGAILDNVSVSNAGMIDVGEGATLLLDDGTSIDGALTIGAGAVLDIEHNNAVTIDATLDSVNIVDSGTITIATRAGASAAVLQLDDTALSGDAITIGTAGTLDIETASNGLGGDQLHGVAIANNGVIDVGNLSTAILTLDEGTTITGGTLKIEPGATFSSGELDIGQGASGGPGLTLNGATVVNSDTLVIEQSAVLVLNNSALDSLAGTATNSGTIEVYGSSALELSTDLAPYGYIGASGSIIIEAGATLDVTNGEDQATTFAAGVAGTLKIDEPAAFSAAISGFGSGDIIDVTDDAGVTLSWSEGASGTPSGTLTLSYNGYMSDSLTLDGTYTASDFMALSDGASGTDIILVDRWSGASGGDWSGAGDWANGTPVQSSNAVVDQAGTITITDSETAEILIIDNAGAAVIDGASGSLTLGSALTVMNGTFDLTGGSLSASSVNVGASGYLAGFGTIQAPIENDGTIEASGALNFRGAVTGTGTFTIYAGASLEFGSTVAAGVMVAFAPGTETETLILDQPTSFSGVISGITGTTETLDLAGFHYGTTTATTGAGSYNSSTNITTLTIHDTSTGQTVTLLLSGDLSGSTWTVTSDGNGGVDIVDPPAAVPVSSSSQDGTPPAIETAGHHHHQAAPAAHDTNGHLVHWHTFDHDGADTPFVFAAEGNHEIHKGGVSPVAVEKITDHPKLDPHTAHDGNGFHAHFEDDTFVFKTVMDHETSVDMHPVRAVPVQFGAAEAHGHPAPFQAYLALVVDGIDHVAEASSPHLPDHLAHHETHTSLVHL